MDDAALVLWNTIECLGKLLGFSGYLTDSPRVNVLPSEWDRHFHAVFYIELDFINDRRRCAYLMQCGELVEYFKSYEVYDYVSIEEP